MRLSLCLLFLLAGLTGFSQSWYLFVGTYTNMGSTTPLPPTDSTGSKGIYVYKWNPVLGHARPIGHSTGVVNPSYLTLAPDGRHLYAATETRTMNAGSVSAFAISDSGNLRLVSKVSSGGDNPVYVALDPSGPWVAVANYTGGSLSVYAVGADGGLRPYTQNIKHVGHGLDSLRQDRPHVHSVVFSPDGRYLYAQDLGLDKIMVYPFAGDKALPLDVAGKPVINSATVTAPPAETGQKEGSIVSTVPGSGPRHLTFHPNGQYAYLVEEMGGCIDVYKYQPSTGALDSVQRIATHEAKEKGPFRGSDVHVSADGRFLYASNRAESTIAVFAVDQVTGLLKTVEYASTLGKEPRNFTLDPTGNFLLVGNQDSNEIVVFRIDKRTGKLSRTRERISVPSPSCLKMVEWGR